MDGKRRRPVRVFRGAAALLLAVCLLCALAGQALAVNQEIGSPVTVNEPAVIVEGNAVLDSNGQPTGFFELSLKVRTKFYLDADGNPVDKEHAVTTLEHPFRSAAVALRYDAKLLTPVKWSYTQEDYIAKLPGVDVSAATAAAPVYLETKKPDNGITASAKAERYTPVDPDTTGPTALLTLSAEAGGAAVAYDRDTTVCVVRFKYDTAALTMDAAKDYAYLAPADSPTGANGKNACVVWFATDVEAAVSTVGQSVRYQGMESMTATAAANRTYYYYYLGAPAMENGLPKTDGAVIFTGPATAKDYASNLLTLQEKDAAKPGALQFKLVNAPSYASNGVNLDNLATILFYDWDDTLINVLTVEKGDARAAVNAHVEDTMIHTDLKASTHADNNHMNSIERLYTYRGIYPAEGPSGSIKAADGDEFPLTNKLDYAFYRRPTKLVTPDGSVPGEPTTPYWAVGTNDASAKEAYPYVNGWAVVADIKEIENVWTTFGVGELEDIDPADPGGRFTTSGTPASYFKLEDFSNLSPGIHYVKACYEPGMLLDKEGSYSMLGDVTYSRYSNVATTSEGSAFSIKFKYGRISDTEKVGVKRTRDPAVKLYYTTDKEGLKDQTFYIEIGVTNTDVMPVEYTPAGSFLTMDYSLVEKYGVANFIKATARTTYGNVNNIVKNFNYDNGWTYDNRLGSDGFVYRGTINQVMEEGTLAISSGDSTELYSILTYQTLNDLNLRMNASGLQPGSMPDASIVAQQVLDAIDKVLQYGGAGMLDKNGNVVLDWHQLQYHIIHFDTGGIYNGSGIMSKEECTAADGGYLWCHQDECGGGSGAIASLTDLLKAAYKVYDGSFPNALDQLNINLLNNLFLRADMKGNVYQPDLVNFKTVLHTAIGKLVSDGPYNAATIGTATWEELQYALIFGAYKKGANITEDFWWQNGQAPAENSFADLAELAFKAYVDGYHPDVIKNVSMTAANKYYLRADKDGVKFAGDAAFLSALKTAVQALSADGGYTGANIRTVDWIEVQHLLIPGNSYRTMADLRGDATIDYWWENGGSPTIRTAGDLMKAAYGVYVNGDDPNNMKGANVAKMKELFLRATIDGDAFASDPPILAALEAAVKAMAAPSGPYDDTDIDTATWKEIQYALIHGTYLEDASITDDYWWAGGGSPGIATIADLLKYGYMVHVAGGDKDLLKNATLTVIDGFYLRGDLAGAKFATQSAFDTAYKKALQALTTSPAPYNGTNVDTATWKELQYALIHGTYLADGAITDDYWWEAGGSKVISTLSDLLTAAYFVYGDGSQPNALDELDMDKVSNAPMWLRKDTDGNPFADETAVKAAIKLAIEKMVARGMSAADIAGITWLQTQYMMLGNAYKTDSALIADSSINYWWLNGGSKPTGENPDAVITTIIEMASKLDQDNIGEETDIGLLTALLDQYIAGLQLRDSGGATYTSSAALQPVIVQLVSDVYSNWDTNFMDPSTYYVVVTWQEVQHYLITGLIEKEGTFLPYSWKPALVDSATTFFLADPLPEESMEELPPETPEMPELPTEPDIPAVPELPEEPVTPEPPVVPEEPETPMVPEEPVAPPAEEPAVPESPDTLPEEVPDVEETPQSAAPPVSLIVGPSEDAAPLASLTKGGVPAGTEGFNSAAALSVQIPQPAAPAAPLVRGPSGDAAPPPPDPRTFYYRRARWRKKTLRPANQGGINL